jgi:hypothetical protein
MWKTNMQTSFTNFLHLSLDQLWYKNQLIVNPPPPNTAPRPMPTEPELIDNLSPEARREREDPTSLPFDAFEERIVYFRDILTEIEDKKTPVEIGGWLKVNAQDIKTSLKTWYFYILMSLLRGV